MIRKLRLPFVCLRWLHPIAIPDENAFVSAGQQCFTFNVIQELPALMNVDRTIGSFNIS